MHAVLPVIRWIDDYQEGRERPVVYIGMETMADNRHLPLPSSQKAVRQLIEHYQVYFVAPALSACPDAYGATTAWLEQYVNVPAWGHTVFTNQRQLLYGDYLIENVETAGAMATSVVFGSDTFKTWDDIIGYFDRLGGQ